MVDQLVGWLDDYCFAVPMLAIQTCTCCKKINTNNLVDCLMITQEGNILSRYDFRK